MKRLASAAFVVLLGGPAARAACVPSGVVLTDPATFSVKRCWTASDLGLPLPLAGLAFSGDGGTLQVIGAADSATSAIYLLPVTRDTASGEVTDLGPPTGSFAGLSPSANSGLDAGLEVGPAGTVFVTYFGTDALDQDLSVLGERLGGAGGTETQFDLTALSGLLQSAGGLTFSPLRTDASTGFGLLQVGVGLGAIYDIPLMPSGTPGLLTPGTKDLFAVVLPGGLGALQYVPGGPLTRHLLYASLDEGTLHRITIDSATGLAIDRNTMLPTQGTTSPLDETFASGFAPGPLGLAFDAATGDAFVATYDANLENRIYQIGGFSGPAPTTTTTTLPGACPDGTTFSSVDCRLSELLAAVDASGASARLRDALGGTLERARSRAADAEQRILEGHRRAGKKAIGKALGALGRFRSRLASRAARRLLPPDVRASLTDRANSIRDDLKALMA